MPHISALKSSKYLTKQDVNPPILVTIQECVEVNVAQEGSPPEKKWALHFNETERPMILNSTNGQIIAGITGKDNTEDWIGAKIVLYNDPNISFQGKLIGGIRARAPKAKAGTATTLPPSQHPPVAQPAPWPTAPAGEEDSDVGF